MPKVLILSAPYGAGHEQVAEALAEAFRAEGAAAEVHDHFRRFAPRPVTAVSLPLFWATLRWAPRLWGLAYGLSARMGPRSAGMAGLGHLGATRLGRYLETRRHDVVVHVHPTPAGALAWLQSRGAARTPHGVVLTDFAAHSQWFPPGLDRYFVATDEIRMEAIGLGVPPDRVVASGIPVRSAFRVPADRLGARAELGLEADRPAFLITGGMRGTLGGIADVCGLLAGESAPFHALVVCGDHVRLAALLRDRCGDDRRFRILGRVSNMERLMAAVDVVVGKAGAVTSAEALAMGRPLILYRSLPGQERGNEIYLRRTGAAVLARDRSALGQVLREVLREPSWLIRGGIAARQLARPDAASVVAKEMLALIGRR